MNRLLLLKLFLGFFMLVLAAISWMFEPPLIVYNVKYPFLSREVLFWFFRFYPYFNVLTILLLVVHQKSARFFILSALSLYTIYHIKLLKDTACPICNAKGLIPFFSIEVQAVIFSCFTLLALLFYFTPVKTPLKPESGTNPNRTP